MQNAIAKTKKNLCHNFYGAGGTLPIWANRYLEEEVIGAQSPNTVDAKRRDLQNFLDWYSTELGSLDIEEWMRRDTVAYLEHLQSRGRAPATVNRALAIIRHFARWLLDQPGCPLSLGSPVRGVHGLVVEERPAQALPRDELNALFRSSEKQVLTETRVNGRPFRNRAILLTLYNTGLRVSEICSLRLDQYTGTHFVDVRRKGRSRTRALYVNKGCREAIDKYLAKERPRDAERGPWLFMGATGAKPLTRQMVRYILDRIAADASAHRKEPIRVHPHQLRHTFGTRVRKLTGSDHETAALLGHSSTRHVGIYSRATDEERAEVLEQLGHYSDHYARAQNGK